MATAATRLATTNLVEQFREQRWFGQKMIRHECLLGEVPTHLPEFRREPFGAGPSINAYLETIVREPIRNDARRIPVATVSHRYALIQHRTVFQWLADGLQSDRLLLEEPEVELTMSEYGERMKLAVQVPEIVINPADHFPVMLYVEALNSVDRSCAFEVRLSWRRLICNNGLWRREEDRLRKVHHLDWMNRRDVAAFLQERIADASGMKAAIEAWLRTRLEIADIAAWVDQQLAAAWGVHAAARVFHIAATGFDGRVGRGRKHDRPHEYPVSDDVAVPGACAPVKNVYHLAQAMSWVAQRRPSIEDTEARLDDIPRLLQPLLKSTNLRQ